MADPVAMWGETAFGKIVKEHIGNGLRVFPLHGVDENGRCTCGSNPCGKENKNAGKHPYTPTAPNGLLNATDDFEVAADIFQYRTDLNVAVATGKGSGIIVIDIDNKSNGAGDESLEKIQEVLGTLPKTMCLLTGNGYHMVFNYPEGGLKTNSNSFGKEYPGIDVRGDGGYIVIYPSRHYSGRFYQLDPECSDVVDLPQFYIDFLRRDRKKDGEVVKVEPVYVSGNIPEWSENDVIDMLSYLDPNMSYDPWYKVGFALQDAGYTYHMFDDWSSRSFKYVPGEPAKKWGSFKAGKGITMGTIVDMASVRGWRPGIHDRGIDVETARATVAPLLKKIREKSEIGNTESIPVPVKESTLAGEIMIPPGPMLVKDAPPEPPKTPFQSQFCFDPMALPGALGDTIRLIVNTAIYEQPELAMMNVITFSGAVFGRKYASPIDTRTNIYMVGIADTGAGKEHSVRVVEKIALLAGLMNHVGANSIRSDIGLLKSLMKNSSILMNIDEFGMLMQALTDHRAPYHFRSIVSIITKLYSKSSSVYKHGEVADERQKELIIASPNLCLFGTTTEESYIPALKKSAINSGELNRYIVIPSRQKPMPKRIIPKIEYPEELIAWWNQFAPTAKSSLGALINNATIMPVPVTVEWGECEELQYKVMCEQSNIRNSEQTTKGLWTRLYENVVKIAMIFAINRDPENPSMIIQDMEYAYSIVDASIKYMNTLATEHMVENEQENMHQKVLRAIRDAGENGLSRSDLLRQFRSIKKRDLDDLLATYNEEEEVTVGRIIQTRGKAKNVYYATSTEMAKELARQEASAKTPPPGMTAS